MLVEGIDPCGLIDRRLMARSASGKGEHAACRDAGNAEKGRKQNCMMFRLRNLNRSHIHFTLVARVSDSSIDKRHKTHNDQDDSEWFHCWILAIEMARATLAPGEGFLLLKTIPYRKVKQVSLAGSKW